MQFNHADIFEAVSDLNADRTAVVCGDDRRTYAELDADANKLAHALAAAGVKPGQHVAMQLYNGLEYITAILAALKVRAVPINVNYRYVEEELVYIYRDSDCVALLYEVEFEDRVAAAAPKAPALTTLVSVGGKSTIEGSVAYEEFVDAHPATRGFPERSGSDIYIIYTGGTTGMPKGTMWRTEDLMRGFWHGYTPAPTSPEEVLEGTRTMGNPVMMAVPPLMHGAGQMATFICFWLGGTMVYVRKFDADAVWKAVEREKVFAMTITGDAMARPLVSALESGSYDLSNLVFFSSTGAILTGSVRDRLQELMPAVGILDNFGSTESGFTAQGASGSSPEAGLRFKAGTADLQVLDDDFNIVQPGSGVIGQVAKTGFIAHGYYNDPDKTARTFVEVEGKRWLLTGDIASVDEDGTIAVYGRGSQAINTGGEKVFPEEIEAVLKGHPGVFDAVVTGVPDEQYGFKVAAVVQPFPGQAAPETADLDEHCKKKIANYKRPRLYTFVEEIQRSPAGKADYPWAKKLFAENS